MIDFYQVIERMKNILSTQKNKTKILDKEVAQALHLDPLYYAVMKKRQKIPYESIAYFSHTHKLNMNWILLAQKPKYLS